jgi:hypothetical protein
MVVSAIMVEIPVVMGLAAAAAPGQLAQMVVATIMEVMAVKVRIIRQYSEQALEQPDGLRVEEVAVLAVLVR